MDKKKDFEEAVKAPMLGVCLMKRIAKEDAGLEEDETNEAIKKAFERVMELVDGMPDDVFAHQVSIMMAGEKHKAKIMTDLVGESFDDGGVLQ